MPFWDDFDRYAWIWTKFEFKPSILDPDHDIYVNGAHGLLGWGTTRRELKVPSGIAPIRKNPTRVLPPSLGLEKIRKWLVYTISWCICKLPQNTTLSIYTTTGARSTPVEVYIQTAVFWAVFIYTKKWFTPAIFSFFLGPNPVVVYIYGVPILW